MKSSAIRSFVLLVGLFVLTSCGSGGGGGVVPPIIPSVPGGGEGTSASPVNLGTIGQPVTHAGSVKAAGTSYYKFKTDATGGMYKFSLTNPTSALDLMIYSNSGWTGQLLSCNNIFTGGDVLCTTQYPNDLVPNTEYYLEVSEWNYTDATYSLGVSRVGSEGTASSPISLTVGAAHDGSVDAVGSSYYTFHASSAGEYRISLATTGGWGGNLLSIDVFKTDFTGANLVQSCGPDYNTVCTVNGLSANTDYFVRVNQNGSYPGLYSILVEKGSSEGSLTVPFALTYGADHAGAVDGNGFSYYTFTPTNSGDSIITLTTTSALYIAVYSDPTFSTSRMQLCNLTAGGVCTVSSVTQGTPYYLLVTNYDASAASYTLNVSAGSNEGTMNQPVALTLGPTHSGTVDAGGTSYFKFTTAESGSYTITLNTALASTYWSLYQDQNFSVPIASITHPNNNSTVLTDQCTSACTSDYYTVGGNLYYNLDANTTYYLTVRNDSAVSGTFTVAEATGAGNSEGSTNDPVVLTDFTPWSARVAPELSSFYVFTPAVSNDYLIRLTGIQNEDSNYGVDAVLYSDATYKTPIGYCYFAQNYNDLNGDLICPVSYISSSPSLTAGTPYYVKVDNGYLYTANTYTIEVSPFDVSLGCNSGGTSCYTFESGIPAAINTVPTGPAWPSDSAWVTASSSIGTGSLSFKSTKPNGNPASYRSCFSFSAANVQWLAYSVHVTTTGYNNLYLYVYDSTGTSQVGWATPGYGNTPWQRKIYFPPANAYIYEWCYETSTVVTGDEAWVDDIELH